MSDIESDYSDYESQKDDEGGLHPGRSDPSRGMIVAVAVVVGVLVLGAIGLMFLQP